MSFLGELKRRNVLRIATAYVVAAWLNRAIDEDQYVFGIRTEPFLRVLHGAPSWERALERVGLGERQIADIVL